MTPPPAPSLAILGCGWLGLPLARGMLARGWRVHGSTTTPARLDELRAAGVRPFLIELTVAGVSGAFVPEFLSTDALVICIPPGGRRDPHVVFTYPRRIANIIPLIRRSPVSRVLFTSSTSVYPELNREVTEADAGNPPEPSGRACLAAENLLRDAAGFQTTIVRLAGLVGPGRHPVRHLAGREGLEGGNAPANLIHLDDAVSVIAALLDRPDLNGVFNACAPEHPARRDYYHREAARLGLPAPQFSDAPAPWKIVSSARLQHALSYTFQHPEPTGD